MRPASGTIGFPAPVLTTSFPTGLTVLTRRRPRPTFVGRFILSVLRSSSESFRLGACRSLLSSSAFLGVRISLFATSIGSVVATGFPCPSPSVLGVSHALDGLIRYRPCGFISPHSHVQGSPFRGFPSRTAGFASSAFRALSSLARARYQQLPTSTTIPCPALRALFRARVRCYKHWRLASIRARSPPGFLLLQVFPLPFVRTLSRPLPLMTFMERPSSRPLH